MLSERKREERKLRKELIRNSAIEVFRTKGLEGATMDQIAAESGFGKATLYYYFKSKNEIYDAILLDGWIMILESIEDYTVDIESPRRTFIEIFKKISELVNAKRALYEFLFFAPQGKDKSSSVEPCWKKYQQKLYNRLLQLIQEGIKQKQFPQMDSKLIFKALGGLFHGMIFLGSEKDKITKNDFEEILNIFLYPKEKN